MHRSTIRTTIFLVSLLGLTFLHNQKPKTLEKRADSNFTTTFVDKNTGISGGIKLKITHPPLNHIDPKLLKDYTIRCNAHPLRGKITQAQFGYYENGKFIEVDHYNKRHIQEPNDMFTFHPKMPIYQWKLEIKKQEEDLQDPNNFKNKYSWPMKAIQPITRNPDSEIFIFPTQDLGTHYKADSEKITPVFNKNINGHYRDSSLKKCHQNPRKHLYLIQHMPEKARFLGKAKFLRPKKP